jgi:hypothetical protein
MVLAAKQGQEKALQNIVKSRKRLQEGWNNGSTATINSSWRTKTP